MAGEAIDVTGSWAIVQAATSTADGVMCTGTRTTITAALTGTEDDYPLLDFKVAISSGTPVENDTVDIYRRSKADTDESPAPTTTYLEEYVCSVVLDNTAASEFYYYDNRNSDKNATYYMLNNGGATLTIALKARGRTYNVQ